MYPRLSPTGTPDRARQIAGQDSTSPAVTTVYPDPLRVVLSFKIVLICGLLLIAVTGCLAGPVQTIQALTTIVTPYFLALVAWRAAAIIWYVRQRPGARIEPAPKADTGSARPGSSDAGLPLVSILVALYQESAIVADLLTALNRFDYPADRTEILFLTEADDSSTRTALLRAGLATHMRILTVPEGLPRTKPRALNHGLGQVRGEFVVVFDAEDRPHPSQIRDALRGFDQAGRQCVCVQAPLFIHNDRDSWISEQFALEYEMHFQILLPFLSWCRLPIPLGGTSNYFRVRILRHIGGWDAHNVTEDAELGMRIARNGFLTAMIPTPTLEEAPISFLAWTRQRSRWIKGHIQTLFTLWQNPLELARQLGFIKLASVHIVLMGAIISALLHGVFFTLGIVVIYQAITSPSPFLSAWALGAAITGIGINLLLALCIQNTGINGRHGRRKHRWRAVSTLIFYWPLQTIATLCAFWDLFTRPFYWSKTTHGLASLPRPEGNSPRTLP